MQINRPNGLTNLRGKTWSLSNHMEMIEPTALSLSSHDLVSVCGVTEVTRSLCQGTSPFDRAKRNVTSSFQSK